MRSMFAFCVGFACAWWLCATRRLVQPELMPEHEPGIIEQAEAIVEAAWTS